MPTRRLIVLGLGALPVACASPDPTLYVLAARQGAVRAGAPRNVEVRSVSLPRYLERSAIVRSSENFRVDMLANDWWGEPLGAMMTRVLTEDLAQRLPGSTVYDDSGAISVRPDVTVEVNVQRFDLDRRGEVLLSGQVALAGERKAATEFTLAQAPAGPTAADLVAAMSVALGRLADEVAGRLAGGA